MKNFCLDNGTIQAFLDGELKAAETLSVSTHIGECEACAAALGEAEDETAFAFSAFDREFNTLVPTQRLWTKINESLVEEKKNISVWQKIRGFAAVAFANPSLTAAAGIFVIFGIFLAVLTLNPFAVNQIAVVNQPKISNIQIPQSNETIAQTTKENPSVNTNNEGENAPRIVQTAAVAKSRPNDARKEIIQADDKENNRENYRQTPKFVDSADNSSASKVENAAYLPGEESYVKTISSLTQTVKGQQNEVMKPSAQIAFARDLAVVDDAIKSMKAEVKKNPKNEAAKQVLYTSYQNKIDLLNSVAEKNELLASLK